MLTMTVSNSVAHIGHSSQRIPWTAYRVCILPHASAPLCGRIKLPEKLPVAEIAQLGER